MKCYKCKVQICCFAFVLCEALKSKEEEEEKNWAMLTERSLKSEVNIVHLLINMTQTCLFE